LPYPGDLFTAKETPCSRYKLDDRLRMLTAEDATLLQDIEALLQWSHQPIARTDGEVVALARALAPSLRNDTLRSVVDHRMNQRTLVAALRRRKRGDDAPPANVPWGYSRWLDHIARHWREPAFGLTREFPWLPEANRLLDAEDSVALERVLLGANWAWLGQASMGHDFDFEAVVIYVLRWNVIDRWTSYSGDAARDRFHTLVDAGLAGFTDVFNEGSTHVGH
jgi:hypothetical protein